MPTHIALLRAVNVGGTGKLPMEELRAMCIEAGFENPRTYIASGNVVFESGGDEKSVKAELEKRLEDYAGKPVGTMVRSHAELRAVLENNPWPDRAGNRTIVVFLDGPPPRDALDKAVNVGEEEMRLGAREIYIFYGEGMGRSKLKIPAAKTGTARNVNTVAKLVEMSRD